MHPQPPPGEEEHEAKLPSLPLDAENNAQNALNDATASKVVLGLATDMMEGTRTAPANLSVASASRPKEEAPLNDAKGNQDPEQGRRGSRTEMEGKRHEPVETVRNHASGGMEEQIVNGIPTTQPVHRAISIPGAFAIYPLVLIKVTREQTEVPTLMLKMH